MESKGYMECSRRDCQGNSRGYCICLIEGAYEDVRECVFYKTRMQIAKDEETRIERERRLME